MGRIANPPGLGLIPKYLYQDYNPKMESTIIKSRNFNASFGTNHVVKNVNIEIPRNHIIAVMGPSGCGKTTYLRCINRMHELIPGATSSGEMLLNEEDVYQMHPIFVRLKIGMVFQRPNPFPNLSIYDNVIAGYKLNGIRLPKAERDRVVEHSLTSVALWNEVKDSSEQKRLLSFRRPAATALHCPVRGHGAGGDPIRRAHFRPRIPFPPPQWRSSFMN